MTYEETRKVLAEMYAKADYEGGLPEFFLGYGSGDWGVEELTQPILDLNKAMRHIQAVFQEYNVNEGTYEELFEEDDE